MHVSFHGARRGVGVSTLVAGLAVAFSRMGETVDIRVTEESDFEDIEASWGDIPSGVTFGPPLVGLADHVLADRSACDPVGLAEANVLVTTASYPVLKALLARPKLPVFDGFVLIEHAGRALSARDVEAVTGLRCLFTIPYSVDIARSVDSGLLSTRSHDSFVRAVRLLKSEVQCESGF